MEKEVIIEKIEKITLRVVSDIVFLLNLFGLFTVLALHKIVPFFPVLFLFDFCFIFGYPLFLRYVLKRKWSECTKDEYLKIKYIMLPYLIMELAVLIYYPQETGLAFDLLSEGNILK